MRTLFHSVVYLSLGLWLGGLLFFGMILAPVAFSQLPPLFANQAEGLHAAGAVVGTSLVRVHWIGMVCGVLFLAILLFGRSHFHYVAPQAVLVFVMLVLTAYSQFSIIPRMDTARDSVGGEIEAVPIANPGRQIFEHLHQISVRIEAIILVCGVVAFVVTAHSAGRDYVVPLSADARPNSVNRP